MDKKDLDFEQALQEKLNILSMVPAVVLSTCSKNRVTSRVVDIACCDNTIYFLTWRHHTKCVQIMENPKVAMCHKNLQIEGLAEIKGSPLLESNKIHSDKNKNRINYKTNQSNDCHIKSKNLIRNS